MGIFLQEKKKKKKALFDFFEIIDQSIHDLIRLELLSFLVNRHFYNPNHHRVNKGFLFIVSSLKL